MVRGAVPLPQWLLDFYVRTMASLLWSATRGGYSSSMMKQPDSMQHRVTRVRAQTPDPVLNIVINCMKNPIKIFKKKKKYTPYVLCTYITYLQCIYIVHSWLYHLPCSGYSPHLLCTVLLSVYNALQKLPLLLHSVLGVCAT